MERNVPQKPRPELAETDTEKRQSSTKVPIRQMAAVLDMKRKSNSPPFSRNQVAREHVQGRKTSGIQPANQIIQNMYDIRNGGGKRDRL